MLRSTPRPKTTPWLCALALATAASAASAEPLTPERALERAAAQSPTLRAALHDVTAAQASLQAEADARVPVLTASGTGQYNESFGGASSGVVRNTSEQIVGKAAVAYTTDVGTSLEVGVESNVSWRTTNITAATTQTVTVGPNYSASLYATARQPLLRGAGTDAVLASQRQAQASLHQAERQRDNTASQTAFDVLGAYWELWYAEQAVEVQERGLEVAKRQLRDAETRANQLGTGAKVDALQFATSVAQIQDTLSQARATRASRALELGRLLGITGSEALALSAKTSPPEGAGPPLDVQRLQSALEERSLELAAMRAEMQATIARLEAANDADQLRLDAFVTGTMGGLWANDELPGLRLPGGRPAFGLYGGLELELPLGDNRARGDAARARAQLEAARARYQARIDAIEAQVGSLSVGLRAAIEQVNLAEETAGIAAQLAEAERQRLVLGTGQPSEIVRAEQTHREAELRKLRAIVDLMSRRLELEHAAGALLERVGAQLARRPS